jgi:putative Mg2+ transporter-C (MgtC) family protein
MSTWQIMWEAVASDFTDLDAARSARIGVRLLMAAVFGGLIGFERQSHGKRAGLRTHMLVALGAALFVVSQYDGTPDSGSRVVQGIAAGIGFLGAGAILKDQHDTVKGLTTAADIWLTAAIGVTAGLGRGSTALLATVLALVILAVLPRCEKWAGLSPPSDHDPTGPQPSQPPEAPKPGAATSSRRRGT